MVITKKKLLSGNIQLNVIYVNLKEYLKQIYNDSSFGN